jgi:hypothetical protein
VKRIHNQGKSIALGTIPLRRSLVDLRIKGIEIQPDINARVGKRLHTRIVIALGIDVVDANRVGANRLHELGVEGALRRSDERVIGDKLIRDAYQIIRIILSL